ncbi:recombinase family protein [Belnapia moabensis]|uniref:recombinase family protein n=1 Tax=Belnapia moabensis TaxID=365533 RepID=UPI00146FD8B3|nr:recombinase family protein [Belnapia moabensis]
MRGIDGGKRVLGVTLFAVCDQHGSPDRLARSVADLLLIMARLEAAGAARRVPSMGGSESHTHTPMGTLRVTMLGAVAEFEWALTLERQREGIAKAKADGSTRGVCRLPNG